MVINLSHIKESKLIYIKGEGAGGNWSEVPPVSTETEPGTERIMNLF